MASTPKDTITIDMSQVQPGLPLLATPIKTMADDILSDKKDGGASATPTDANLKNFLDINDSGSQFSLTETTDGGDEGIDFDLDATGLPANYVPLSAGAPQIRPVWNIPGYGVKATTITVTAGEALAERDIVYWTDSTPNAFLADANDLATLAVHFGIVTESGGISISSTGEVTVFGEISGFSSLDITGDMKLYLDTTAGGLTTTRPVPSSGGAQVAIVELGFVVNATTIFLTPFKEIKYLKLNNLADNASLVIQHAQESVGGQVKEYREIAAYEFVQEGDTILTDYPDSNQDTEFDLQPTRIEVAQGFKISPTGDVGKVSLFMSKTGNPTATVTVEIRSGVEPTTLVAASTTFKVAADVGTSLEWVDFLFNPVELTAATQYYAVMIVSTSGTAGNHWQVGYDASSPTYSDGSLWVLNGSWVEQTTVDMIFRVLDPLQDRYEPLLIQRWSLADTYDIACRYSDAAGSNEIDNTQFKNIMGSAKDILAEVRKVI